jgi:L-alanine-DL-glutamate epimerase-like enolase superfamily enzyme
MGESSIASAAGLHLAIAKPGLEASETIGPLFITNDPATGFDVDMASFRAVPSERPGLGVGLR